MIILLWRCSWWWGWWRWWWQYWCWCCWWCGCWLWWGRCDVGNGDIDCSGTADFKRSDDACGSDDSTRSFVFLRSWRPKDTLLFVLPTPLRCTQRPKHLTSWSWQCLKTNFTPTILMLWFYDINQKNFTQTILGLKIYNIQFINICSIYQTLLEMFRCRFYKQWRLMTWTFYG